MHPALMLASFALKAPVGAHTHTYTHECHGFNSQASPFAD